jgi:CopG family nickel-responsive transcriptional regulator
MSELARFSVSLEADLLESFDRYVRQGSFATRSEAIRQLLHEALTRKSFVTDQALVLASLTLVYEHHRPHLVEKLLALQHEHAEKVIASMHVHIDHDRCLEVLILRGRGQDLQRLADALRGLKGVHRGELTLAEPTMPTTALGAPTHQSALVGSSAVSRHDHSHQAHTPSVPPTDAEARASPHRSRRPRSKNGQSSPGY